MIFAADVGGTYCRFALYANRAAVQARQATHLEYKPMSAYTHENGWHTAVTDFLQDAQLQASTAIPPITAVCFAMAGPVTEDATQGRYCELTNVSQGWAISEHELAIKFQCAPTQVRLINDMEAIGYAIPLLRPAELALLNPKQAHPKIGNRALIAAGTGLGELAMLWQRQSQDYLPCASEGSHADFGPCNAQQGQLWAFLDAQTDHVNYEDILSGSGLVKLYHFLWQQRATAAASNPVADCAETGHDPAPYITESGLNGSDSISQAALALFMDIYGAEAGNVALRFLAVNGVYIGGGIALKLWNHPRGRDLFTRFIGAFQQKSGKYATLNAQIPLRLILNADVGLLGAAWCGVNTHTV